MNRSPYHLTGPAPTLPPQRIVRSRQRKAEESHRSGTPTLVGDEPHHDVPYSNPIFQPQLGSAHRYGASRSMMPQHCYPTDNDISFGESPRDAWNQSHPLQSNPALTHAGRRTLPQKPQHGEKTALTKTSGVVRALQRTITKQLNTALAYIEEQEEVPFFLNQHSGVKKSRVINKARLAQLVIPCVVVVLATFTGLLPTRLFRRSSRWDRLEQRHLGGRQCVMNLFVDKHEANEFNPDFDPSADKDHVQKPVPMEGTYRTKGQVEVINRFISSVAAAFRPNVSVQQHIVFTGSRDGGHLAQEALKHWPPRGSYRTQLHVFADQASDDLDYDTVQHIEDRFKDNEEDVHIYDSSGNIAGNQNAEDDDAVDEHLKNQKQQQRQQQEPEYDTLPDLKKIVFQNDDDEDTVIPYLHVDGTSMARQMSILSQAEHLLQDRKIVVVGLEHSPDLDINDLIEFFSKLNYKTFMLGLRQLTRIDNLCPEILDNVMQHPTLASSNKGNWLTSHHILSMPPFFVAMPRGRHSKEEMGIQHMYDLFSGSSGVSQVKTANDRVANVK